MTTTVLTRQGDSVDALAWQHYGRSSGVVEQILAANPKLCELPVVLPEGTAVTLPDITTTNPKQAETVQLWT